MRSIDVRTNSRYAAVDVTDAIAALGPHPDGLLWMSVPHTTAALILCEADDKMLHDVERMVSTLLEPLEPFSHDKNDNPNGSAHLMSAMLGSQLIVRIADGRLAVGSYQRVIFVELDGPRKRRIELAAIALTDAPAGGPS
ncbi:secondary thiamine-phosphate synthase enzyme YjbQ [soil metagenome]